MREWIQDLRHRRGSLFKLWATTMIGVIGLTATLATLSGLFTWKNLAIALAFGVGAPVISLVIAIFLSKPLYTREAYQDAKAKFLKLSDEQRKALESLLKLKRMPPTLTLESLEPTCFVTRDWTHGHYSLDSHYEPIVARLLEE